MGIFIENYQTKMNEDSVSNIKKLIELNKYKIAGEFAISPNGIEDKDIIIVNVEKDSMSCLNKKSKTLLYFNTLFKPNVTEILISNKNNLIKALSKI